MDLMWTLKQRSMSSMKMKQVGLELCLKKLFKDGVIVNWQSI